MLSFYVIGPYLCNFVSCFVVFLVVSGGPHFRWVTSSDATAYRHGAHAHSREITSETDIIALHRGQSAFVPDSTDVREERVLDRDSMHPLVPEEYLEQNVFPYTAELEEISTAVAPPPGMHPWEAEQAVATLNSARYHELKDYERKKNDWFLSRVFSGLKGKPSPTEEERAFRDKRKRYRSNAFVHFMADHDTDQLQKSSITYGSLTQPVEQYMEMINKVRKDRLNIEVRPAPATLPDPSVAYTPFHREIAKQKSLEKMFRVHYMTGGGRKFHYFFNPEEDCYWKLQPDGIVACVPARELVEKPHHDPAIAVAVDQTGMFDTLEEAASAISLGCADFYLEKSTWSYYCIPAYEDLRAEDYKRMKRYKNRSNAYLYHQWVIAKAQEIEIPEIYRPPRPTGGIPPPPQDENYNPAAAKLTEKKEAKRAKKQSVQQIAAFIEENKAQPEAVIDAEHVQYPLQEGVIILRPAGYSVEPAPALDLQSTALLASVSKEFAESVVTAFLETHDPQLLRPPNPPQVVGSFPQR
ncbi:hypothetical protein BESB_009750 [Besnoitia besnoiti]|uniref:Transmembrane protein n=1 Tax=Besnoitia besnoiti TaxID=94643 RepID=A0A2A9MQN3_BESBE|nr:hypothetical protein BESB_009750 [Besnoitia besnoiti]PFH38633.1 hypothetical protein BESB_009750 [Besnoitia besnoiti]